MKISKIKIIMLVTGIITCTMSYAVIFPQEALISVFGVGLSSIPLAGIIVRSWGVLVTMVGGLLIYGAFKPYNRAIILSVAGFSKLTFILLLLIFGREYFPKIISLVVIDSIAVVLYAISLCNPPIIGYRQK